MIELNVKIISTDEYIPTHHIDLQIDEDQVNIILSAAKAVTKLKKKITKFHTGNSFKIDVMDLIMDIAEWEGEEYSYTMKTTVVKVRTGAFCVCGLTEDPCVFLESEPIRLEILNHKF